MKIRKAAYLAPKRDHTHEDKTKVSSKMCPGCKGSGRGEACITPCDHCGTVCEALLICGICKGEGVI